MTDRQGFNGRIWPGEWQFDIPGAVLGFPDDVLVSWRTCRRVHEVLEPETPEPEPEPTPAPAPPAPPEPVEPTPPPYEWYTIKPGDSWWRIAHNHGLTVDELQLANLEAASRAIHPGQRLKIPI